MTNDFTPKTSNPIAIMNQAKTLVFDLKIMNDATSGSDITATAAGTKNYDVDFYFSYANQADLSGVTKQAMTITAYPASMEFALTAGATSALLTFTTTATLPTANCNSYVWFCGCVKEGAASTYTDEVTTNNCKCKDASTLISCSPGLYIFQVIEQA